jgi:universal stress protein A
MKTETTAEVPTTPALKLERILVPMDFSSASQKALEYAVPLASKFEAKITLIHVVELICGPSDPTFGYVPLDNGPLAAASAKRLERIAVEMIPAALLATTLVRHGIPYHEITNSVGTANCVLEPAGPDPGSSGPQVPAA